MGFRRGGGATPIHESAADTGEDERGAGRGGGGAVEGARVCNPATGSEAGLAVSVLDQTLRAAAEGGVREAGWREALYWRPR